MNHLQIRYNQRWYTWRCNWDVHFAPILFDFKQRGLSETQTIVILSDCNGTRTHNHIVRKRRLNHLAKQSLKLQILCLFRARISLTFRQLWSVDSLWNAYVTCKNIQSIVILFVSRCFFKFCRFSTLYILFGSLQKLKDNAFVLLRCKCDLSKQFSFFTV